MNKSERKNVQQQMFALIKKWNGNEISQKEFCNDHDLPIHIFYYWLRKYKQASPPSENGFLPIDVTPAKLSADGELQIHYPNGVMITLDKAVSTSRIKALINAI